MLSKTAMLDHLDSLFMPKHHKWVQEVYAEKIPKRGTCYCIMGAIEEANKAYGLTDNQPYVELLGFTSHGSVTIWNDTPGRTIKDVRERLKQARANFKLPPSKRLKAW